MSKIAVRLSDTDPPFIGVFPLSFLGDELFKKYRDALRSTAFAFYDAESKLYRVPLDRVHLIIDALKGSGFTPVGSPEIKELVQKAREKGHANASLACDRAELANKTLEKHGLSLFPFQHTGVDFLASHASAILADEMGLGKTVQSLLAVADGAPIIIVCPAVLKRNWAKEIAKFRPEYQAYTYIAEGRDWYKPNQTSLFVPPEVMPAYGDCLIVNYDILPEAELPAEMPIPKWVGPAPTPGTYLIGDEAHYLKNPKAKRTLAFRALSLAVRQAGGAVHGLTGTPLLSEPSDLWAVLQAFGLGPAAFGSWEEFLRVMNGRVGKYGHEWGKPTAEAGPMLANVMLRRERKDVLKDLPEKRYREIPVEIAREEAARLTEKKELLEMLMEDDELPPLEQFASVRMLLSHCKIAAMKAIVDEYIRAKEPLVVFSAHRKPIEELLDFTDQCQVITGDTAEGERALRVEEFQKGVHLVLAGTIAAMGVGITLTRAAHMLFVDREYTPALNLQAEDRIARIGQERGMLITDLVAEHPMDVHLTRVLRKKQAWIAGSVEKATVR